MRLPITFLAILGFLPGCSQQAAKEPAASTSQQKKYVSCMETGGRKFGSPAYVSRDQARLVAEQCRQFLRAAVMEKGGPEQCEGMTGFAAGTCTMSFREGTFENEIMRQISEKILPLPPV